MSDLFHSVKLFNAVGDVKAADCVMYSEMFLYMQCIKQKARWLVGWSFFFPLFIFSGARASNYFWWWWWMANEGKWAVFFFSLFLIFFFAVAKTLLLLFITVDYNLTFTHIINIYTYNTYKLCPKSSQGRRNGRYFCTFFLFSIHTLPISLYYIF